MSIRVITYTVHEPPEPPADRIDRAEMLVFVKEGFNWAAAIFGPLWLIVKGLWLALLVYLAVVMLLGVSLAATGASDQASTIAGLAVNLILGFEADSIQRLTLDRRGWRMIGTATGRNRDTCERRFFDAWLPTQPMLIPDASAMQRHGFGRPGTLAEVGDGDLALASPSAHAAPAASPRRGGWRRLLRRG